MRYGARIAWPNCFFFGCEFCRSLLLTTNVCDDCDVLKSVNVKALKLYDFSVLEGCPRLLHLPISQN